MNSCSFRWKHAGLIVALSLCGASAFAQKPMRASQLDSLNQEVVTLTAASRIEEAMTAGTKAAELAKQALGAQHPTYATALFNLAEVHAAKGAYPPAETLFKQALAIRKKAYGENNVDYATTLVNIAQVYASTGRYALAEPLYKESLAILKKTVGERHPAYVTALEYQAQFYFVKGRYPEAGPLFEQVLAIRKQTVGERHPDYVAAQINLAQYYSTVGRYAEAETNFKAALVQLKFTQAEHPLDYARAMNNLAMLYKGLGRYAEAYDLFVQSGAVFKKTFGEQHIYYGISLGNQGEMAGHQGRYAEAEAAIKQASALLKKGLGEKHNLYLFTLNNLAFIYKSMGRYAEAEPLYTKILGIWKEELGVKHPNYATTLDNLAQLNQVMGRQAQSEALFKDALAARKLALGEEHASYATSLNNLANFYKATDRYAEAEPLLATSQAIIRKTLGEKHQEYATSLINQAQNYTLMKRYAEAEPIYQRALAVIKEALGEQHPMYPLALSSQGLLYQKTGRDAAPLFREALAAQRKSIGEDHPDHAKVLLNLATFYQEKGRYAEAQPLNAQATTLLMRHLRSTFVGLSEREKQLYSASLTASTDMGHALLASLAQAGPVPAGAAQAYDNLLFTKGLLLASTAGMQQRLLASGDTVLLRSFGQWQATKRQLVAARALPLAQQQQRGLDPARLDQQANELEKVLAARTSAFRQSASLPTTTWQQVQQHLRRGEVALELVRFRGQLPTTKDTVYYAAYLLTPRSPAPQLVLLKNGNALEDRFLPAYRQRTHAPGAGARGAIVANAAVAPADAPALYRAFWQPIAQALPRGTKTLYLSADGAYQQLNLATLQNPASGKYLLDGVDVRLVGSTRDLVRDPGAAAPHTAGESVLVGAPAYRLAAPTPAAAPPAAPELLASARTAYSRSDNWLSSGEVPPLPGTAQEVEALDALLAKAHWPHRRLVGGAATEEAVRDLHRPRLLHVATHGFFLPEGKSKPAAGRDGSTAEAATAADPLLRSGLLLAGVSNFRDAAEKPATEDGILTAYEASLLDLQGTELVVLSACETGLGQVQAGEGVYGLQRGFTVAGARAILMSLWKVDDAVTHELMVAFYQKWLGGETKRAALLAAQKQVRKQHPDPYYWGAFILVGE